MSVEFVLLTACIYNNISSELAILAHAQASFRKFQISFLSAYLPIYFEATHDVLTNVGKLA